ncbi:MAG TPA: YhdP family protein, partial [Coxiellaceae bacterium]|nr:YhdP family protein [Coxiellaceae bacterium]
ADEQFDFEDINFADSKNLIQQTLTLNDTLTWLLTQGTVIIQNVSLTWKRLDGSVLPVDQINLQVTQEGFDRSIVGNAKLSNGLADRVVFSIRFKHLDIDKLQFDSDIYLSLSQMNLADWTQLPRIAPHFKDYKLSKGEANLQLWMQWHRAHLHLAQAKFNVQKLIVQSLKLKQSFVVSDLSANIAWKHFKGGWELLADHIRAHVNDEEWLDNAFGYRNYKASDQRSAHQVVGLKFLRLYDLSLILTQLPQLSEDIKQAYRHLNPQGSFNNLVLEHEGDSSGSWNSDAIKLIADFTDLRSQAWDKWPGFSHFSGHLYWSPQLAQLEIDSRDFTLRWPFVFSKMLQFDKFRASLNYLRRADQWLINANSFLIDDANILLQGQATFNHLKMGNKLSLDAKFRVADVSKITPYLPQSKMDGDLYKWLATSFKGGAISSGALVFEGLLADFPFKKEQGHFQVLANLKDIDLKFDKHWPMVEKINGQLIFDNALMRVKEANAVIANNPISHINAVIPNLMHGLLIVRGHVDSNLKDGLEFLNKTPMEWTKKMSVLSMKGAMNLDLKLRIPLNSYADKHFKFRTFGHLSVDDAKLNLLPLNLQIEKLKGKFDFTEDSIVAPHLSAELYSEPVEINVDTFTSKSKVNIAQFNIMGSFNMDKLQEKLHNKWLRFFHGSSVYQAQYNLNLGDTNLPNVFTLESNLQGISIDMGSLYHKDAKHAIKLEGTIQVRPEPNAILLGARYGNNLSAEFNFARHGNELKLTSGEVALGSLAKQQTTPGLVLSLEVPKFSWTEWQKVIAESSALFDTNSPSLSTADSLRLIHLKTDTLEVFNQKLEQVDLKLQPGRVDWSVDITSSMIAGHISVPRVGDHPTLVANLQRLYLPAADQLNSQTSDVSKWPALNLNIDDLRYSDQSLGRLVLLTEPGLKGIDINKFRLTTADYDLSLSGSSTAIVKNYRTEVSGQVKSSNFGTLLSRLKITSALADADGVVNFSLNWLGSLLAPQMTSLQGYVDINLTDGVIVNLSSGARSGIGFGRLLNLFSLQALPSLAHLSQKGFDFSILKAHFDLKNGNASTNNVMLDGPVAKILAQGRIGYVAQDYDMVMTVRPYVTASIPTLAGLALANPVVGVVGWLVNKVVISPAVSRAVQFKYRVTGPWHKPTVVELEKPKTTVK